VKLKVTLVAFFTAMAAYLFHQVGIFEWLGDVRLSDLDNMSFASLVHGGSSGGDCPGQPLVAAPPTLAQMVALSETQARAWKPDAVLIDALHSKMRPDGTADYSRLTSFSPSARSALEFSHHEGKLRCETHRADQDGRALPELRPDFLRDGAALYKLAQAHGQALIDKGYDVDGRLWGTGKDMTWIVDLHNEKSSPSSMRVIVDANTGALQRITRD